MVTTNPTAKVIMTTGKVRFGGSRISNGIVSVDLWSDGEVLGAAWSMTQPEIEGEIFQFRGSLTKVAWAPRSQTWRLLDAAGIFVGTYPTRHAALTKVERLLIMDAFRELNRVQAER